jgi:hypothetical protein
MACRSIKAKLKPFIDGELGVEEAALIQDHVSSCVHCQAELKALEAVWEFLGPYPEAPVPPGFAQRVVARAKEMGKKRESPEADDIWESAVCHLSKSIWKLISKNAEYVYAERVMGLPVMKTVQCREM